MIISRHSARGKPRVVRHFGYFFKSLISVFDMFRGKKRFSSKVNRLFCCHAKVKPTNLSKRHKMPLNATTLINFFKKIIKDSQKSSFPSCNCIWIINRPVELESFRKESFLCPVSERKENRLSLKQIVNNCLVNIYSSPRKTSFNDEINHERVFSETIGMMCLVNGGKRAPLFS